MSGIRMNLPKKTVKNTLALIAITFLSITSLSAVEEKRLIVMDFKNIEKNKDFEYLELSITDAVIEGLKKDLVFKLMPASEWKLLAKTNFFFEDSFHTPTIGMQLGLLGKQDVVIGGGFIIRGNEIITSVHILGIAERKVLKQFDVKGYADNRIWDGVKNISDTIVTAARDILPNEKEWSSIAIAGRQQISLSVDLSPMTAPAAISSPLPSGTEFTINPNDFPLTLRFSVDYMRIGIYLDNLIAFGNFSYAFASQDFEATGHSPSLSTVVGDMSAFSFSLGGGYRVYSYKSFYVMPRLGFGYSLSNITLDFTKLTNPPSAISGNQDLTIAEASFGGIASNLDVIVGYQFLVNATGELKTQYQMVFIDGFQYSNLFISLNLGVKF